MQSTMFSQRVIDSWEPRCVWWCNDASESLTMWARVGAKYLKTHTANAEQFFAILHGRTCGQSLTKASDGSARTASFREPILAPCVHLPSASLPCPPPPPAAVIVVIVVVAAAAP